MIRSQTYKKVKLERPASIFLVMTVRALSSKFLIIQISNNYNENLTMYSSKEIYP
jgi:hypothetical protein